MPVVLLHGCEAGKTIDVAPSAAAHLIVIGAALRTKGGPGYTVAESPEGTAEAESIMKAG